MRDTQPYWVDGVRWPSVTEALKMAGMEDLSHIPRAVLEEAAHRGREVHIWTALLDDGDALRTEVPAWIDGYVEAWEEFKAQEGFQVRESERVVYQHQYRYCGRLDCRGILDSDWTLVDKKTSNTHQIYPGAGPQTAGYEKCLKDPHRRIAVTLASDGTYRVHRLRDRHDIHDVLSAVRVAWFQMNHLGKDPEDA